MDNAVLLTADDIDRIAESLAMYCIFWYCVARLGFDSSLFVIKHVSGRFLTKSSEGKSNA